MKLVQNPTLPENRLRKTSLVFHTSESPEHMQALLKRGNFAALKYMGDAYWLCQNAQYMNPNADLVLRTYQIQTDRGFFSSAIGAFDRAIEAGGGNPDRIAQTAIDALSPEIDYMHNHNSPHRKVMELWNESHQTEFFFNVCARVCEKMRARYGANSKVIIGAPNIAVGNYNEKSTWLNAYNGGYLDQKNKIITVHGYSSVFVWAGDFPGWQLPEIAANLHNLRFENMPWGMFPVYDDTLQPSYLAFATDRVRYWLEQELKIFDYELGVNEYFLDNCGPIAGLPLGGVGDVIAGGGFNQFLKPGEDSYDFAARQLVWGETRTQLQDKVKWQTVYIYNDRDGGYWQPSFGIKGPILNKWLHLEETTRPATPPDTNPTTPPGFPSDGNIYIRLKAGVNAVNVRTLPDSNLNNVFDTFLPSETRRVFAYHTKPDGRIWYQVTAKDSRLGWVASWFFDPSRPLSGLPEITNPAESGNPQNEALLRALADLATARRDIATMQGRIDNALPAVRAAREEIDKAIIELG